MVANVWWPFRRDGEVEGRGGAATLVISRLDMYCTNLLMYRMMVLLAHLTKVRC